MKEVSGNQEKDEVCGFVANLCCIGPVCYTITGPMSRGEGSIRGSSPRIRLAQRGFWRYK